ncbi:MAG: GNAT family N-acetyltransferase [Rhodobacteraceae bacterium]|nr:GNAT family N-acetyltransferase [Paracoccaceae bacterium]
MDVRLVSADDIGELREILNRIILAGGTTALESPLSAREFAAHFVSGPDCIACFVATDHSGKVSGFQALCKHKDLPPGFADIATFSKQKPRSPGTGTALFRKSVAFLREHGYREINALIRADNVPGLAYYAKMGFLDHSISKGVPLRDGTPVDRVIKRYRICPSPRQP